MPLLLARPALDAALEDEDPIVRQVIGQLVEELLLLRLVVDGGEEEDDVELLVGQIPPGDMTELRPLHATPGLLDDFFVGVDPENPSRSLPERFGAEEALVAADVEDRLARKRLARARLSDRQALRCRALSFSCDLEAPEPSKSW